MHQPGSSRLWEGSQGIAGAQQPASVADAAGKGDGMPTWSHQKGLILALEDPARLSMGCVGGCWALAVAASACFLLHTTRFACWCLN